MVDPVLFRHLTFHDDTKDSEDHITSIVHRLLEPNDRLRYYVRRFDIGPFQKNIIPSNLTPSIIIQALNSFKNLRDFSWNVGCRMPPEVLTTFHQRWPQCCLHIKQSSRSDTTLDQDLIASQQLVTLEMPVLVDTAAYPSQNEWKALTKLVANHKSLKVFRPSTQYSGSLTYGCATLIQFQLDSDIKLPTLEDFRIPNSYHAYQRHARQLLEAMSWSSLRILDIGFAPTYITETLIGQVPQLKSLSVMIAFQRHNGNSFEYGNYSVFIDFLESIQALEELSLKSLFNTYLTKAEWPIIFRAHQNTLKKAKVGEIISADVYSGEHLLIPEVAGLEHVTLTLESIVHWGAQFESTDSWVSICSADCCIY
jgi:hypothetical protein